MSWLAHLADELTARGVTGREHRRILLELRDHIECDPGCENRLGAPRELAARFADELATHRARRCAWYVFGALATAAFALVASQAALGRAGGYPGYARGLSTALFLPAAFGMVIGPQVALVAGTLAALRAVRRRRASVLPAAEVALIRRRAWVAVGAGFATVAALEVYVANFSLVLPARWLVPAAGLAALAGVTLFTASIALARSGTVVSGKGGEAGDVYDDVPALRWGWLRRQPWRLGAVGSLSVALAVTLFEAHAERSWFEGIQRGVFEGLVAAVGFVLLARVLGLVPAAVHGARREAPLLGSGLAAARSDGLAAARSDGLAADADRSRAELILRESYGEGRLSVEELVRRVDAVHAARTVAELREALSGLPDCS